MTQSGLRPVACGCSSGTSPLTFPALLACSSAPELMQTEMHHIRTLKIMSDVYSRGMTQELQCEQQVVEKVFPCLDHLLSLHSQFFQRILERKKESLADRSDRNFVIRRIGDILVSQVRGRGRRPGQLLRVTG